MTFPKKLRFKSPAKINLGLHIHKKREDGFHELETILQMVDWFDEIVLEETSLNVPDYPKRLGAKFEGVTVTKEGIGPLETVTNKPFIGLERLLTK